MSDLAQKQCAACQGGLPPLSSENWPAWRRNWTRAWLVIHEHHLEREFKFANFRQALLFTNLVGDLADEQNHHPDIYLAWGKVKLTLWTHKIDGLSESDFVFAAKVDQLPHE